LWKLVFMAILVNFGLVITAPIVGFASNMSNYFINATSPSAATGGYVGFVNVMTQAFAPQQSINGGGASTAASGVETGVNVGCSAAAGAVLPSAVANILCPIVSKVAATLTPSDDFSQMTLAMVFSIFFSSLIAFTFLCLAILLIIRYLMLGGLLIVLPLAWLTYIFPKFDNSYSKWWNTFIKWTLFPPLALFFIYLAFLTAANTGVGTGTAGTSYLTTAAGLPNTIGNGPEAAIATQTGLAAPVQQALDEILLVGLTIMGLMFANSLAGKAGSTVVNGGVAASRAIGGYVGKQTKKGARAGFRAVGGNKVVEKMRSGQLGGLQKVPVLGWAAGRGASLASRALEPHLTNKEMVDAAKKKVPDNIEQVKQNLKGNMNSEDRFAHLAKLIEKGELSKDQMVGNEKVADFMDKNQNMIKNYAFEKSAKDMDKILMSNINSRNADRAIKRGDKEVRVEKEVKGENGELLYKAGDNIDPRILKKEAEREFYQKTPKADFAKSKVNEFFSPEEAQKNPDAFTNKINNIANYRPEIASDLMKKMNGSTLKNFSRSYEKTLDEIIRVTDARVKTLGSLGVRDKAETKEFDELTIKLKNAMRGMDGYKRAYSSVFGSAAAENKDDSGGTKDKDDGKH
jgi:hypothetical protein